MPLITPAEMLAWANPQREQFSHMAHSDEEWNDITDFVRQERQGFLWQSVHDELKRRNGEPIPTPQAVSDFDLTAIPIEQMLTFDEHKQLVLKHGKERSWSDYSQQVSHWKTLADLQHRLIGIAPGTSKYSCGGGTGTQSTTYDMPRSSRQSNNVFKPF